MSKTSTATALDELAAAPPRDFARARQALVTRLLQAGDKAAAAEVKRAKKPTVAVWVVNRLGRADPSGVAELVRASDRVKAAQLGRRGFGGTVAEAAGRQRDAVAGLLRRAEAFLREAGIDPSASLVRRVETTLVAAASDEDSRDALQAGGLQHELTPQGFDVFGAAVPSPRQTTEPRPASRTTAPRGSSDEKPERAPRRAADARLAPQRPAEPGPDERARAALQEEIGRQREALERSSAAVRESRALLDEARAGHTRAAAAMREAIKRERASRRALDAALERSRKPRGRDR